MVAAWEAETGWATASERVAWLSAHIRPQEPRRPATIGRIAAAALVILLDLGVLVILGAGIAANDNKAAAFGLLLFMVLIVPNGWASWVVWTAARSRRRRLYLEERQRLLRLRGCGDPYCQRCDGT